jgi:hypothetical protein
LNLPPVPAIESEAAEPKAMAPTYAFLSVTVAPLAFVADTVPLMNRGAGATRLTPDTLVAPILVGAARAGLAVRPFAVRQPGATLR